MRFLMEERLHTSRVSIHQEAHSQPVPVAARTAKGDGKPGQTDWLRNA